MLGQYSHVENENGSERPIKILFNNMKNSAQSVRLAALAGIKVDINCCMSELKSRSNLRELFLFYLSPNSTL